jgi:hypothetical protein
MNSDAFSKQAKLFVPLLLLIFKIARISEADLIQIELTTQFHKKSRINRYG